MEKNRNILLKAIGDLPLFNPHPSVWERLEINTYQFPVNKRPLHEPNENLWDEIETTLYKKPYLINLSRLPLSLFAIIVIGLLGILGYQANNIKQKSNRNETLLEKTNRNKKQESESSNFETIKLVSNTLISTKLDYKKEAESSHNTSSVNINDYKTNRNNYNKHTVASNVKVVEIPYSKDTYTITQILSRKEREIASSIIKNSLRIPEKDIQCSSFSGSASRFSIGILSGFDQFISEINTANTSISNWNSIIAEFAFKRKNICLSLGIGNIFSDDMTTLNYNYLKNELIRSYTIVDSVFYDTITGTMQFITTNVDVYDSIEYTGTSNIKISYRYFQIPIALGYQIMQHKGFSFYLYGSLTYLNIVSQKEYYPNLNLENSRLINKTSSYSKRTLSLFKISIRPVLEYGIGKHFTISLAPNISYYTKPIYENVNGSNPYSWGIDAGLHFIF